MRKKIVALILCLCMAVPLVGCGGGGNDVVKEKDTINVMMINAGYGTTWIEEAKEKFEALYAEEGYKVNILPAKSTFQGTSALSEIRLGYDKTGYDIVISSGYTVQQLTDEEFGVAVEPLNDVMTSKPINFDGSEGEETIEALHNASQDWSLKIGDTYWAVPWSSSIRGVVCNMKVLNKYGITELPVTTDELFEQFDIVYNGVSGKKGMRPVVWAGSNAYGYALPTFFNTIAQLMGVEEYEKFYALDYLLNEDGTIKADGYKHLDNDAVKEAINVTMHSFDVAYSLPGSLTQKHTNAHASIITGKAAFMFDGEFFFNEVRTSFPSYLNDVRFCQLPITSKLGVDLKLDGTGNDRAKCDDILSFMTKKVDEGKSAADIKSLTEAQFSITLTDEQVNRVIEARTTAHGSDSFLNIIKDSQNVEISKLFIRMLLSEDMAEQIFPKYGMMSSTYSDINPNTEYQFIKDTYAAKSVCEFYTTSSKYPNTVRAKTNLYLIPPYNAMFPVTIKDEMGTVEKATDRDYEALTNQIFNKVTSTTQENWATYMANGGYKLGN